MVITNNNLKEVPKTINMRQLQSLVNKYWDLHCFPAEFLGLKDVMNKGMQEKIPFTSAKMTFKRYSNSIG